ncbi:MAG: hypothetical protein LBT78_02155 [Tannerella sp.]|jgi:hypothetical protein|nr:hypothetical protein [Tannerella sp.]
MEAKFDMGKSIITCIILTFVLSAFITGCGKNYDYEISSLIKKTNSLDSIVNQQKLLLEALQNTVSSVQFSVSNLNTITSVVPNQTGYLVSFTKGEPIQIYNGTSGSTWTIGPGYPSGTRADSLWYKDGVQTDAVAIPESGPAGVTIPVRSPDINSDGYWVTYEWNPDRNDFDATVTEYSVNANLISYITENPSNTSQWILHVKRDLNGNVYEQIILSKSGGGGSVAPSAGSISLLGYTHNANPAGNLSLSSLGTVDLNIPYWYIDSIFNVTQNEKLTSWSGQKEVEPKQLLTLLDGNKTALVLSSDLAAANIAGLDLRLKNSNGELLPLTLGTPVRLSGLLTKASDASGGPVYLASLIGPTQTYQSSTSVVNDFKNKFRVSESVIYYLEDTDGAFKSNYSSFSIIASDSSAVTVPIASVASITGIGASGSGSGPYTVRINEPNTIGFDAVNGRYVYDYLIDGGGSSDIDVYDELGAFIIRTTGTFTLTILKLHVNGKIYEETIATINAVL